MSTSDHSRADVRFHASRAASFDEDVTGEFEVYDELALRPYLDQLEPGLVADVGCGTGEVSLQLALRGFEVRAVDHSPDMLEVAREKAKRAGVDGRISFHLAEITGLPFGDSTLDGLTCQRVLHHVETLDPVLIEFKRVLKPGGFLYLSDYLVDDPPAIRALRRLRRAFMRRRGATRDSAAEELSTFLERHEIGRTASEFVEPLRRHGFDFRHRFYCHVSLRGTLTRSQRMLLIRVLSYPWRGRRGSMVFVFGSRPGDPTR